MEGRRASSEQKSKSSHSKLDPFSGRGHKPGAPWLELFLKFERKPLESAAVFWMFLASDCGFTSEMIADERYMPKRYHAWKSDCGKGSIDTILRNPAAKGRLQTNGKIIAVPAVVSEELFERVKKARHARKREGQKPNKGLFNRFTNARCKACRELMRIRRSRGGFDLICTNITQECPARRIAWPIDEDFKRSFAAAVGKEIGPKEFWITLKEMELKTAEFELGLWQEKKSNAEQRTEFVYVGTDWVPRQWPVQEENVQIEQCQKSIIRIRAELRKLKEQKENYGAGEYVDALSLDRVNEALIAKQVADLFLTPARLGGQRRFTVTLKTGERVKCCLDNPA